MKQLSNSDTIIPATANHNDAKIIYNEKGYWKNILASDIIYLESKRSYCNIHSNNGIIQLSKSLLKVLENLGNQHSIVRIHKSYAVNLPFITQIKRGMNSSVILVNGVELPVSIFTQNQFSKKNGILK